MSAPANLGVDVVVNNYNYGRFVTEAVESALRQTHERVRVIIVDDGSSDGSRELLRRYEDRASIVLKENGGQASALNAGMERSEGDVVIFLDADDTLHPEAAARVASAFAADDAVAKVQFRNEVIDAEGKPTGVTKPATHLPMPSGDMRGAELAFPYDLVWMSTSANAFRADALRRILPIPERDFQLCADWYLVHLMSLLGDVVSLDEVCGSYRLHGANSYEPQQAELDVAHLRDSIRFAAATSPRLLALADQLGLPRPQQIYSIADLANRLISLRIEPEQHPIASDRRANLIRDAIRAVRRRTNASAAMRLSFIAWFAVMATAPRPVARRLAVLFLFPQSRRSINRLLGRLQRRDGDAAAD